MSVYDNKIDSFAGPARPPRQRCRQGSPVVNVASKCGLTPQYTALEQLQADYGNKGFSVIGFQCNQFGGQEPGTAEDDRDLLQHELRRDVPDGARRSRSTANQAPALRSARGDTRRRGPLRRHPLELREVPHRS